MANNSNNSNKNQMQELLSKIQKVSQEEYESLYAQIFELLDDSKHKTSEKQFKEGCIEKLVDLYLQTFSDRVFKILVGISSPLDECLFNILMKKINIHGVLEKRFSVFILISNIVHRSPTWLPNIVNLSLLNCFFNILKNEQEIVILAISALILVELIATLPCLMTQCLDDIFTCFSRLSTFLYKGMNLNDKKKSSDKRNLSLLNLNSIVYRVFIRLYAMYPCNFLNYLKMTYGIGCNKENDAVFHQTIEPMLNKIRFHPFLITASKDRECDKSRWLYKEAHDILDECGQYSIDPIESSYFDDVFQLCEFFSNDDLNVTGTQGTLHSTYSTESSNAIFSELSKEISEKDKCFLLVSLKNHHYTLSNKESYEPSLSKLNLESAQEAITMSQKETSASINNKNQTNVENPSANKNLVKPVAISANSKPNSLTSIQKKNINKKQFCFSPFKPIMEIGNVTNFNQESNILSKGNSPIDNQLFHNQRSNSSDQLTVNNENEQVDMEIISYNLDNNKTSIKNDNQSKDDKNDFTLITENEISNSTNEDFKVNNNNKNNKVTGQDSSKIPDDFVLNVKTSLKQINTRIRYQSNCLPETDKDEDDYFSSISLANMLTFSKSCPMLYFKSDDDSYEIIKEDENNSVKEDNSNNLKKDKQECLVEKASRVNLILEDPNSELKQTTSSAANKTCKSVDFTKETKSRLLSNQLSYDHTKNIYFNKLFSSLMDSKRHLFQSSSSIDFQAQQKMEISSPHELLDRTLSTLSDVYLKDSTERHADQEHDSNQTSRRDSVLNTNSSASSIEHIPSLSYLNTNSNEEDMRKILAIMYAQLVFERHQRNLHVIRNRRLYKKSKECIQLEEKYNAIKVQIKSQVKEIENLRSILAKNSQQFENERKMLNSEISQLQENLEKYKNDYEVLENQKVSLELHYKQEIDGLNKNFRTKELELNKYLCNFNKNIDLMKLEMENLELKNQIFLFGEFCGKIRDAYCHSKCTSELNDKLILESIEHENENLRKKNIELGSQLKFYSDKCSDLENQLKQEEIRHKSMVASNELEYFRESLKVKDNQIEVLKTLVVNYEAHIKKLNGEIATKVASSYIQN